MDFTRDPSTQDRGPVDEHEDLHGTCIASILLALLPRAEVFIGRIARIESDFEVSGQAMKRLDAIIAEVRTKTNPQTLCKVECYTYM